MENLESLYQIPVIMASATEDMLEDHISGAVDSLIATAQVREELPHLHRSRLPRFGRIPKNPIILFHGLIDWCGVSFDYIEYAGNLYVLGFWQHREEDRSTRKFDCVLEKPTDAAKYLKGTDDSTD